MVLSEIPGNAPQEYADDDRYQHGDKSYSQRDPGPLEHPGKDISSKVIGPKQENAQGRSIIRFKCFNIWF